MGLLLLPVHLPVCLSVFLKWTPRSAWPELGSGHQEMNLISALEGHKNGPGVAGRLGLEDQFFPGQERWLLTLT